MDPVIHRRTWVWSLLAVSLAFNAGIGTTLGVRTCQQHGSRHPGGPSITPLALNEQLQLTSQQRTRMQAVEGVLFEHLDRLHQEMATERTILGDLLSSSNPDRAAIAAQLDKIAALQREAQQLVVERILEQGALLTAEQRETFNQIVRSRICPCASSGVPCGHQGHPMRNPPGAGAGCAESECRTME